MHSKMREALRDGSVSMRSAGMKTGPFNNVARETTVQPSKMAKFHNRRLDDGRTKASAYGKDQISDREMQDEGGTYGKMGKYGPPTKDRGAVTSPYAKSRGSRFSEGSGGVVGRKTPSRDHIDSYPEGVGKTFPAGGKYAGGPAKATGNTKMKGKQPVKSGGPEGHNARAPRYYGGPNGNRNEGTY